MILSGCLSSGYGFYNMITRNDACGINSGIANKWSISASSALVNPALLGYQNGVRVDYNEFLIGDSEDHDHTMLAYSLGFRGLGFVFPAQIDLTSKNVTDGNMFGEGNGTDGIDTHLFAVGLSITEMMKLMDMEVDPSLGFSVGYAHQSTDPPWDGFANTWGLVVSKKLGEPDKDYTNEVAFAGIIYDSDDSTYQFEDKGCQFELDYHFSHKMPDDYRHPLMRDIFAGTLIFKTNYPDNKLKNNHGALGLDLLFCDILNFRYGMEFAPQYIESSINLGVGVHLNYEDMARVEFDYSWFGVNTDDLYDLDLDIRQWSLGVAVDPYRLIVR